MESPDRRYHVIWTINECLEKAPILCIGDDLEEWGRDVLQILLKLGLAERDSFIDKPDLYLDLLLSTRDDNTISNIGSPFGIHDHAGDDIIDDVISRYVIYSTIHTEVADLLISNFPETFRTQSGGFPNGWRKKLGELLKKEWDTHEAECAAEELEDQIKRAKEAKRYKKKRNELKKIVSMHNREAERLKKKLRDLEQLYWACDVQDSEMEDSEMGEDEMEEGNSE